MLMWTSSSVTPQNFNDLYKYIDHFVPLLDLRNTATNDDNVSNEHEDIVLHSDRCDENSDNSSADREVIMLE